MRTYWRYYAIFRRYIGERTLLLGAISLVTTLTEGAGIALFFAYLSLLTGANSAADGALHKFLDALKVVGIEPVPSQVLSVIVGAFVLRGLLILASNAYQYRVYMLLTSRLTTHLTGAIAHMDYVTYLRHNTGELTHLVTKEINKAVLAYYQVSALLPKAVAVITYMVLAFRMDWRFASASLIFGACIAAIFQSVNALTRSHSRRMSETESRLTALAIQMIQSFKYLVSTNSVDKLQNQVNRSAKEVAFFGSRIGLLGAVIPAASEPLIVIFVSGALYLHVQIFGGSASTLFVVLVFLYRVLREATVMQGSWQTFQGFIPGVDSIIAAIERFKPANQNRGTAQADPQNQALRLEDVSLSYGDKPVLKSVNLQIEPCSTIAIVGESGSGKSSLLDLITGILEPTHGKLFIGEVPYAQIDLPKFRSRIGYVTQEIVLFNDSVINNVSGWDRAEDGRADRVRAALRKAHCGFVEGSEASLNAPVGDRGLRLSGGQRQRLMIAREMYRDPALLILDEATSALDSESEALIQRSVNELKGKTTILIVAHRLSTIRDCDRIILLRDGKIEEDGDFATLYEKSDYFRNLCQLQRLQ